LLFRYAVAVEVFVAIYLRSCNETVSKKIDADKFESDVHFDLRSEPLVSELPNSVIVRV
jgi:hypothetical protein